MHKEMSAYAAEAKEEKVCWSVDRKWERGDSF